MRYGELESRSNQLARLLRDAGCARGDRVALVLPKSIEAIVAMVATVKAGGVYVPIDPASPPLRAGRMLAASDPRCALVTAATAGLLDDALAAGGVATRPRVGCVDGAADWAWTDLDAYDDRPLAPTGGGDDLAHILFTSGSTGIPKGVMIAHANVVRFVDWALRTFATGEDERISSHPPLHFDLSTFDVWGTFAAGAELHLVPPELNLLPHRLAAFIREHALTQWFSVPSVLTHMAKFDVVRAGDFPSLRRLLWCGETFPTPGLVYWMRRLPHAVFFNLYGPTEATIASSWYRVPRCPDDERAPVPIGTACDGEELLVLDESLAPCAPGDVGDLYLAGVGLSPGYWRDPEKTATVFRPDPRRPDARIYKTGDLARVGDDGLVYLVGRADTQVKVRGYRIELGEIEAALNTIAGVRECAVVVLPGDGLDAAVICCAFVAENGLAPAELRKRAAALVPPYMVPARWLPFVALPKNPNGKTDRPAVRARFAADGAPAAAAAG